MNITVNKRLIYPARSSMVGFHQTHYYIQFHTYIFINGKSQFRIKYNKWIT